MLTKEGLRTILLKVFKLNEEFIVPMDNGWYVPSFDKEKIKTETYIGYRILSKRALNNGSIRCRFRLSFIGKSAEEFCDSLLFWGNDFVVKELFAEQKVKLINAADELSYPLKDENMTGILCYFVDFDTESIGNVAENSFSTEKITSYIEEYIERFVKNEITLSVDDIRNWPVVAKLCKNIDISDIVNAMKKVKKHYFECIYDNENNALLKILYKKTGDDFAILNSDDDW